LVHGDWFTVALGSDGFVSLSAYRLEAIALNQ